MDLLNKTVQLLALTINGLFIGAMIIIGLVLVPFWQASDPQVFLDWFTMYSGSIGKLMIPLGPGVLILSIMALILDKKNRLLWAIAVLLTLANILYFPLYFLPTNNLFADQSIDIGAVSEELNSWSMYHWHRIYFACGALLMSLVAVMKSN